MSWTDKKLSLSSLLGSNDKPSKNPESESSGVKAKDESKILKCAMLKKMKKTNTFTKKFFVLYDRSAGNPAKLVYYDSEKKHSQRMPPKREIVLETCFNINRKQDYLDKSGKKVMALNMYTLDDCVQIGFDDREDDLNDWLETMLILQHGKSANFYGQKPKPNFDIIWQVNVKGFKPDDGNDASAHQWTGPYRLCVTPEYILLYPLGEERPLEVPHACIRNFMVSSDKLKSLGIELGRTSPIGSGLLSLESEEKECVSQLHEILRKSMMGGNHKDILGLNQRYRSSSFSQERGAKPRAPHVSSGKPYRESKDYLARNRTISEPVGEGGKPGHMTPDPGTSSRPRPMSMRYSPGILSPTSPVGSVSAGLSDDGTGSSSSIYDPTCNGDFDPHTSYAPEVIPEESSGEVSIEFKRESRDERRDDRDEREEREERDGSSSLPRKQRFHHQKQPSLPDYMSMGVPPPLPARNSEFHLSTSLPYGYAPKNAPSVTSPSESTKTAPLSSDYHSMCGGSSLSSHPVISSSTVSSDYLPMDSIAQISSSTPPKSCSTQTLVPSHPLASLDRSPRGSNTSLRPSLTSPRSLPVLEGATSTPRPIPGMESRPLTVLTPPEGGKRRIPSGEAGYVIMSPGVSLNHDEYIQEEPASLAALEESLGGRWQQISPRHSSPVSRRSRRYPDSQRNSSCLDENDGVWAWRLNEDADFSDDFPEPAGRSPVSGTEDYMAVTYPRPHTGSTPRTISRISPASSSSAISGTPSSGSRFTDIDRLERVQSFLRDEEEDKVTCRPPRGEVRKWGRHIDIPSSKSSSRSNISPFGRTPPSVHSGSPTVASRLEGWFRHRAGSVPNRPPLTERRRHRTQSEGEKDSDLQKK